MMEQALGIIKSEEHGSNNLAARLKVLSIAKAADHAVRASIELYLLHAVAVPGLLWEVDPFGDHPVATAARRGKPPLRILQLEAYRGEA
jgi:hypothetical protein